MLYVDGRLVLSAEELAELLSVGKRELDFEVVFTQVKTSESWVKKGVVAEVRPRRIHGENPVG